MKKTFQKTRILLSMKFFIVIIGCTFIFNSCEGFVEYSGIIYDATTAEPIDSVQCIMVNFEDRNYSIYSDSLGNYNISTPMVGCVPNCGKYDVKFSKQGYKTLIANAPTNIYLEKE